MTLEEFVAEINESDLVRLKTLLDLPADEFQNLIDLVHNEDNIRRYMAMTPLRFIHDVIKECALGEEIWWDVVPTSMQMPALNTNTGQMETTFQNVLQIVFGMRGALLGEQNYIFHTIATDAIPDKDRLRRGVMTVLEAMRTQKAAQLNGPANLN